MQRGGGTGIAASDSAFKSAAVALQGIALHDGPEERIWLRTAEWANGYIIDLGDSTRRVVEVLPTGWRILDEYQIVLPDDLPPGDYTVRAGLYAPDGARLPAAGEGFALGEVHLE